MSLEVINNRVMAVSLTVRFQGSTSTPCVLACGFGVRCTELSCCLLGGLFNSVACVFITWVKQQGKWARKIDTLCLLLRFSVVIEVAGLKRS